MSKCKRLLALLLVSLVALTACNSGGGTSTPAPDAGSSESAPAAEGSTEDAGTPSGGGRTSTIAMLSILPELMELRATYVEEPLKAAFPDDTINFEIYTDRQSLQVQIAGGGGPDIMDLDGPTDAVEFAKAGRIVDLDKYADQYGWSDIFYEWAYGTGFYSEKLYSLPNSFEGMVFYYNTDVMEANGWEKATNAEELVALMQKCQDAGVIPMAFGNSNYQGAVDWLYSTFTSCYAGPEALKAALQGTAQWTDEPVRGSIQQMVDWWQAGYIGDKKSQAISNDDMVALFASGKAAMMIDGTWVATDLINTYPDCNWDVELMPELRDGVGRILPLATGGVFAINTNSGDHDFAAEILNWFFTSIDRHQESVVDGSFQPYPVKAVTADFFTGLDERLVDMYGVLMDAQAAGNVGYCSWTFYPSDARVYMNENTDGLFLGSLTVDEYLTEVQGFVDKANADGTAPVLP